MIFIAFAIPPFQRVRDGVATTADDPERGVWYSIGCGYWTDDWTALGETKLGIPVCPRCGCPGMIIAYNHWMYAAEMHQGSGHPRYVEWLKTRKNVCGGRGYALNIEYLKWLETKE